VMSSGTTGLAKAVVLSHRNIVAAITLAYDRERKEFEVTSESSSNCIASDC
jgi:acyl-CoA synthetase (AMP-forming)/AMP-acid ligase II